MNYLSSIWNVVKLDWQNLTFLEQYKIWFALSSVTKLWNLFSLTLATLLLRKGLTLIAQTSLHGGVKREFPAMLLFLQPTVGFGTCHSTIGNVTHNHRWGSVRVSILQSSQDTSVGTRRLEKHGGCWLSTLQSSHTNWTKSMTELLQSPGPRVRGVYTQIILSSTKEATGSRSARHCCSYIWSEEKKF